MLWHLATTNCGRLRRRISVLVLGDDHLVQYIRKVLNSNDSTMTGIDWINLCGLINLCGWINLFGPTLTIMVLCIFSTKFPGRTRRVHGIVD